MGRENISRQPARMKIRRKFYATMIFTGGIRAASINASRGRC
ncbi:hypothetical protein [Devosia sp. DBB001]|nr:hypothetical protein [Devosia sp. DBB001]